MTWDEFDYMAQVVIDSLDEFDGYAMHIAISAFGYNKETIDTVLYTMFGMGLENYFSQLEG